MVMQCRPANFRGETSSTQVAAINAVNFNSVKKLKWVNFELSQKTVNHWLTSQKS